MIEIGIGFLFALIFITAYLLVKKLIGGGPQSRWRELCNHSNGGPKQIGGKPQPQLFLKTAEMREHHSHRTGTQRR